MVTSLPQGRSPWSPTGHSAVLWLQCLPEWVTLQIPFPGVLQVAGSHTAACPVLPGVPWHPQEQASPTDAALSAPQRPGGSVEREEGLPDLSLSVTTQGLS